MTPQARRRLKALVPSAHDAIPQGGVERAKRVYDALPSNLAELDRLLITKSVLRMISEAAS